MIYYFLLIGFTALIILIVIFWPNTKKVWFEIPGFKGGIETHQNSKSKKSEGIIAEWMQPDWFRFSGGAYSYFVPVAIDVWLQVYFRNTENTPLVLQSANVELAREGRFWGGHFYGVYSASNQHNSPVTFPKTIPPGDALPLYFKFTFTTGGSSPEDFISQVKVSPELIFTITYQTKEGAETKEKKIQKGLDFKNKYKRTYLSFLQGMPQNRAAELAKLIDW